MATWFGSRGDAPPDRKRPVVGVLEANEVVVVAALIRVMALRQEQERTLRGPGVFFCRVVAKPLEALPVERLFGLLLPLAAFGFDPSKKPHETKTGVSSFFEKQD